MNKVLIEFLAVGFASALGGMLRFGIGRLLPWTAFPVATLVINVTGSFFLGWFLTMAAERAVPMSEATRLAIAVGFVGAYTTFSTYMFETDRMFQDSAGVRAMVYLVGSIVLGLVAVRFGVMLGKRA